jgi:hypothetical protein
MTIERPPTRSRRAQAVRAIPCMAALLFAAAVCGCSYVRSDGLPYAKLALPYDRTQLKSTTSLEVLSLARDPAYQFKPSEAEPVLLTQSDTAVAYSGRSTSGRKTWLDLIAFDESRMTAARKYFFCIDERAAADPSRLRHYLFLPTKGLLFDSEFAIDPEVLTTPYATEEAQKIAILQWLAERFKNDVTVLVGSPKNPTQGNEQVTVSGTMVSQVFQGILNELAQSPGLAQNLAAAQGIQFPHASLGAGRLRMLVENDTAVVTIRVNLPLPPLPKR